MSDDLLVSSIRVCTVPDHFGLEQTCSWPDGNITWTIQDVLPGLTADQMFAAATEVYAHIASECGITPKQFDRAAQARILVTAGHIDGPGGTLAWAELPCGNIRQSTQKYDTGERRWVIHPNGPPPSGTIDWWRVFLHETIHSLGIPHGGSDIMKPMYDTQISRIGEWTRNELRRRYGPPKPAPLPPPVLPPSVPTPTPNPSTPTIGGAIVDVMKRMLLTWLLSAIATWKTEAAKTATPIDDLVLAVAEDLLKKYLAGNQTMTKAEALALLDSVKADLEKAA